jgi:hypothetical protein
MTGFLVALDPQESPGAGKKAIHISGQSSCHFSMVVNDSYRIHRYSRDNPKTFRNVNLIPCHPSAGFRYLFLCRVFGRRASESILNTYPLTCFLFYKAPLCPVWRKIDNKRHPSHKATADPRTLAPTSSPHYVSSFLIWRQHESQATKEERHRARTTLSLALIAQVNPAVSVLSLCRSDPFLR